MVILKMLAPIAVAALAVWTAGAEEAAKPPVTLVSFDDLEARLEEPGLRLLDVRPRADYDKQHLPGAVWVDIKAAESLAGKPGGLTDRAAWEAWLAPLAIAPGAKVLVLDGQRQLGAARVWWLLRYLGVDDVGLVNGNVPLWIEQKRPVSSDPVQVEPIGRRVSFRADRHATKEDVLAAIKAGAARVVDARSDDEFRGKTKLSKRGGHIPAACHLEWNKMVGPDGRFLDEQALRAKVTAIGLKPGEAVVTHCQGGGRASVNAFVLERLGFPTRNYYLGWSDWGNADEVPVETEDQAEDGAGSDAKPE